jgi:hypothetical protein
LPKSPVIIIIIFKTLIFEQLLDLKTLNIS